MHHTECTVGRERQPNGREKFLCLKFFLSCHKIEFYFTVVSTFVAERQCESVLVTKSCLTLMTPWTVAHQAPLSMGFNTAVGCHFLLWRIIPNQGSNLCLLHWQGDSLPAETQGKSRKTGVGSVSLLQRSS